MSSKAKDLVSPDNLDATQEVLADIIDKYVNQHLSIEAIRHSYNISRKTVENVLKLNNVVIIKSRNKVMQRLEPYKDDIIKLYVEDGLSLRAIAALEPYNTTDSTIMRFLNNNDICTSKKAKIIKLSDVAV